MVYDYFRITDVVVTCVASTNQTAGYLARASSPNS